MMEMSKSAKSAMKGISIVIQLFLNILFYVVLIMAVVKLSGWTYNFAYQVFGNVTVASAPGKLATIEIEEGEGTRSVADELEKNGLIVNADSFYVRAKLTTGSKKPILPGTYTLNSSMTYDEILAVLTATAGEELTYTE